MVCGWFLFAFYSVRFLFTQLYLEVMKIRVELIKSFEFYYQLYIKMLRGKNDFDSLKKSSKLIKVHLHESRFFLCVCVRL